MKRQNFAALSLAALLAAATMGVIAQDTGADPADSFVAPTDPLEAVEARQALMQNNGQLLGALGEQEGGEALASLQQLKSNFSHIPPLFPEGSIVGDSRALPVIWENWEGFTAIAAKGEALADEAIAALDADDPAWSEKAGAIGQVCGECHSGFRGPNS